MIRKPKDSFHARTRWLIFFGLMGVASSVWAAGAAVISCSSLSLGDCVTAMRAMINDQSVRYLGEVFGSIGGLIGLEGALLARLFGLFNAGIWTVAVFVAGYTVLISSLKSAQEGAFMTQTMSIWVLLRSVSGIAVLLPLKGGYSIIQMLIMLIVLKGVFLANQLWGTTLDWFGGKPATQKTLILNVQSNGDNDWLLAGLDGTSLVDARFEKQAKQDAKAAWTVISTLFQSQVCMYRLQETYHAAWKRAHAAGRAGYKQTFAVQYGGMQGPLKNTVYLGGASTDPMDADSAYYRGRCGLYRLGGNYAGLPDGVSPSSALKEASMRYQQTALTMALSRMEAQAKAVARDEAIQDSAGLKASIISALQAYLVLTRAAAVSLSRNLQGVDQTFDAAKRQGWMMAPRYYLSLVNDKKRPSGIRLTSIAIDYPTTPLAKRETSTMNDYDPAYYFKDTDHDPAYNNPDNVNATPPMFTPKDHKLFDPLAQKVKEALLQTIQPFMEAQSTPEGLGTPGRPTYKRPGGVGIFVGPISEDIEDLFERIRLAFVDLSTMQLNAAHNPINQLQKMGATLMGASMDFWITGGRHLFEAMRKNAGIAFGISFGLETGAHIAGFIRWSLVETAKWMERFIVLAPLAWIPRLAAAIFGSVAGAFDWAASFIPIIFSIDMLRMLFYLPMAIVITAPVFVMGMTLGIYLPFIPILLFTFAALSWLLSVAEGMVSGPLIALGITHPEGHDFLGRSEQALILLLGLFIRPASMIIGLGFSILLIFVMVKAFVFAFSLLLAESLSSQVHFMQASVSKSLAHFVLFMVYMLVFVWSMVRIFNYACTVIYDGLGAKIVRWLGGPQDRSIVQRLVGRMQGQFSRAMQGVGEGAGSTMRGKRLPPDRAGMWRYGPATSQGSADPREELRRRSLLARQQAQREEKPPGE